MKLNTAIKYCLGASLALLAPTMVQAQGNETDLVALLSIVPSTPTTVNLSSNQSVLFKYTLTNQSIARTFAMPVMTGVTPLSGLAGECAVTTVNGFNTVTLGQGQSCTLTLAINGSQINPAALNNRFPEFCPYANGQKSPFSCSYPCDPVTLTLTTPAPLRSYVVSQGSGPSSGTAAVTICDVLANGTFSDCQSTTDPLFESPTGIAVNEIANRIYVADPGEGNVLVCPVLSSKLLGTCLETNLPTGLPYSQWIALNQAKTKAYISRSSGGTNIVTECSINQTTGDLTSCTDHSGFTGPLKGVALNRDDSILYVIDNNSLLKCTTSPFACSTVITLNPTILNNAVGIFAAQFGDFVKITVPGDIVQCTVSGVAGNCTTLGTVGLTGTNTGIDQTETNGNTYVNNTSSSSTNLCIAGICATDVLNPDNPQGVAIRKLFGF